MAQNQFHPPRKRYTVMGGNATVLAKAFSIKQAADFVEAADRYGFDVVDVIDTVTGESILEAVNAFLEGPAWQSPRVLAHFDESEIPY